MTLATIWRVYISNSCPEVDMMQEQTLQFYQSHKIFKIVLQFIGPLLAK